MPVKIMVELIPQKPVPVSSFTPDRLHGLFFNLLKENTADQLHRDVKGFKPFALSSPQLFKKDDKPLEKIQIYISLLEDRFLPMILSDYLLSDREVHLNGVPLKKVPKPVVKEYNIRTYNDLMNTEPADWIHLKFLSPTSFRRNKIDFPFPLPEVFFKSALKKWIAFSGVKPEVDLRPYFDQVEIAKYRLSTQKVEFSSLGKLTTFRGEVSFYLGDIQNKEARRWFSILGLFTKWSGSGRKTAMGLGATEVQLD